MAVKRAETKKEKLIRLPIQLCAATVLFVVDLWIKAAVKGSGLTEKAKNLISGVLSLTFTKNTGAAWGIFRDKPQLLSFFVAAALLAIAVYSVIGRSNRIVQVCLTMIFAGGAGNLADRIVNGYVTDYISCDFIDFPVFNFADCLIVVGCILLMVYLIYDTVREMKTKKTPAEQQNG